MALPMSPAHHHAGERVRRRIRALLDEVAMTQVEFAERMGKSAAWSYKCLNGGSWLGLDDLDKAANVLGVQPADLVRNPEDEMVELSFAERRLIEALRKLPQAARDALLVLVKADTTPYKPPFEPASPPKPIFGKPRR